MNLKKIVLARLKKPKFKYVTSNELSHVETDNYTLKRRILRELAFVEDSDEEVSVQLQLIVSMCKKITLSPVEKISYEEKQLELNLEQPKVALVKEKIVLKKGVNKFDFKMEISSYDWKIIQKRINSDLVKKSLSKKFSEVVLKESNGAEIFFKIDRNQANNVLKNFETDPDKIKSREEKSKIEDKKEQIQKDKKDKKIDKIKNILKNKKQEDKSQIYFKKESILDVLKIINIPKDLKDFSSFIDQITLNKNYELNIYIKDNNFKLAVDLLKKKQGYNNKFPKNLRTKLKNFTLEIKEKTILIKFEVSQKEALAIADLKNSKNFKISKIVQKILKKLNGFY